MNKLTTFEKIGEQFNLNDHIISKMSEIYIKDCNSYDNTLKYYNNRYQFIYNNDYHNHRIKMDLVDSEFRNYIVNFLNSNIKLELLNTRDFIRMYPILGTNFYYNKLLDYVIKINKFKNIIRFIKLNKHSVFLKTII